jgi:tetratricopeptide (TPR) repeat protein
MRTLRASLPLTLVALALGGCATTAAPSRAIEVPKPVAEPAKDGSISPTALRKFEEAVKFYEDGKKLKVVDLDALARRFEAAVEADDRLAEAHYDLGVIAEWQGKHAEAVAHYRRAIEAKPSLAMAYENLAVLMENEGKRDAAEEQYKAILRAYPDDAGARARLAELYREGGDADRALELAREALLRDPKNVTAHKVLMRVYLDRDQLPLAKLVALRATKLDDKDPELYFAVGQILEKEGNGEAALLQYRRALSVRGDHLPSRQRLAEVSLAQRNWPAAEEALRALLRASPDDPALHYDLGLSLRAQGKLDEALAEYAKAKELAPDDPTPTFATSVILHKYKDQPEKALEGYRTFVSGNPVNLPADHPVFAYMRECEALIQARTEARAAEARAQQETADKAAADKAEAAQKAKLDAMEAADRKATAPAPAPAKPAPAKSSPAPAAKAPATKPAKGKGGPDAAAPKPTPSGAVARDPDEPVDDL